MIKLIPIFFSIFLFGFGGVFFTPKTFTGYFDTAATTNIQNGTGNWDFSTSNFSYNTTNYNQTKFVSGSTAAFGRVGSSNDGGTVTVSGTQSIGGLLFDTVPNGNYTITSGNLTCAYPNCTITNNVDSTIASTITGNAGWTKDGPAILTLTGANNYTGGTNVWDGTLQATTTVAAFPSPGPVTIAAGATAWLNVTGTQTHSNIFSGAGTLKVTVGGTGSTTTSLSGNLSGLTGTLEVNPFNGGGGKVNITTATQANTMPAGSLVKVESGGTIFYPFALNYAAGVQLNGGTTGETYGNLRVDNGNVTGPVTLMANSSIGSFNVTGTISGIISGAFAITKEGSGNIIFTNNNTYTGTTTISGGTLTLGNGLTTNNIIPATNLITNNSAIVYDTPSNITHSGTISGSGSLRKDGPGILTITESNPYSGATTVSAGTLSLSMTANDRNASSGYTISSGATLNVNVPSGTARICNTNPTITGTGTFTKTGGLQFYMADNGNNKQANFNMGAGGLIEVQGGMIYSASTLATNLADLTIATSAVVTINDDDVVGNQTAYFDELSGAGTIRQHGSGPPRTLSVGNNNGTATFTGVVADSAGTGVLSFIKAGTGTQVLSGANTYTGTTSINEGLLGGSGSTSSAATVGSSGTIFGGTGSGNPGTATFGSITFSSSTSAMNIYSNGTNLSKVISNGNCTMGGANFNLMQAISAGTFTVLQCANAPTGEFPSINTNSSGNIATLYQSGTNFLIGTSRGVLDLIGVSPSGAYSLRKIRNAYAGSAIRVRRSDNATQDIGFTTSGDLDVSALTTFVGAGSGYVSIMYDQSTLGRNATQATAANQPQIVNAGALVTSSRTGVPSMSFSPNQWLDTGTNLQTMTNAGKDGSVIAVIKSGATSNAAFGAYGPGGVNRWSAHVIWQDNNVYMDLGDVGTNRISVNALSNVNQWLRYSFIRSGNTATLRWSGAQHGQKTTASATCTATGNFLIGYASNPDAGLSSITGNISEFFIFSTGLSDPDLSILESSQGSYWRVP